jgi:uncharacterized membrane protein YoaK (UPF0700 family)
MQEPVLVSTRRIAKPASDAVRDRAVILLTGSAGCIDTAVFLKSGVFPANMTGNTVVMGLGIVHLNVGNVLLSSLAFGGFILGVAIAAFIASPPGSSHQWSPRISLALVGAAVILFAGAMVGSLSNQIFIPCAVLCTALAMGIQSESVQQLGISGISGNVITSTLTTGIKRLVNYIRLMKSGNGAMKESPRLHFSCWLSYLVGAILGATTAQWVLWTPFALSSFAILIAVVSMMQSDQSGARVSCA